RRDHDRQRKVLVISRHADVVQVLGNPVTGDRGIKLSRAGEIGAALRIESAITCQRTGDLPHAVGTEIEADTRIVIANGRHRFAALIYAYKGKHEFIGDSLV